LYAVNLRELRGNCGIIKSMYDPHFEITPEILKNIGVIEAARAVIENSPLIPLYERQFQEEATIRKVHFSTAIEGNYLQLEEVKLIVKDVGNSVLSFVDESGAEVIARRRDIHEVINYRNVVKYIERLVKRAKPKSGEDKSPGVGSQNEAETDSAGASGGASTNGDDHTFNLTEDIIFEIHKILLRNIFDEKGGIYREARAVSVNFLTGEKLNPYEGYGNVEIKMHDLIDWYNSENGRSLNPVLKAGLLHLELVRIHPFEEGNGRLARSLATLSLSADGYDVGHFFCLDEYYDSNAKDYYEYLSNGFANPTDWLDYFVLGMAVEFNRVKTKVVKMSKDAKIKERTGQVYISERQEQIIEWLNNNGSLKNSDFDELFPNVSDDTVLREIKGLLDSEIIIKKGRTKSARYELR